MIFKVCIFYFYFQKNEVALNGHVNLGYTAEMKICKPIQADEPNLNDSLKEHIKYPSSSNTFSTPNSFESSQSNIREINDTLGPIEDFNQVVVVNERL